MKKIKLLFLLFVFAFLLDISFVYAEEVENENQIVEVEEEKEEVKEETKPKEEIKQTPKEEVAETPKKEEVTETPKEEVAEDSPKAEEPKQEVVEDSPKAEEPKQEEVEAPKQEETETPKEEEKQEEVEAPKQEEIETPKEEVKQEDSEEPKQDEPTQEEPKGETTSTGKTSMPVQKAKVIITKVDEKGNLLEGAILQIVDSEGNEVYKSKGESKFEVMLPNGTYTLIELKAPDGYEIAEKKTFTVEIIVDASYQANTLEPNIPCEASTVYYVKIKGVIHEVYCINQYLTEPGPDAEYNGKILTPEDVRNYTKQVTLKDPYKNTDDNYQELHERYPGYLSYNHGHLTDGPIDVSDQTLNDQELYDKLLDIVYRRTLAKDQERFSEMPDEAISYLTEAALKTYTNAGITQLQRQSSLQPGDEALYEQDGRYYWYLMHMYKDYVYDPDSPYGWRTEIGHGDALGNFARHWAQNKPLHETRNLSVDHPEYAEYFYYLLGDETSSNLTHPDDMHIYIYTSLNTPNDDDGYQNLLGITGYLEDYEPEEIQIEMKDEYSKEKRSIHVEKVWDDKGNVANIRPDSVTVNLYADGIKIDEVELSAKNNWKHDFTDLEKYNEGQLIRYTVDEVELEEYFCIIDGNMDEGFTLVNINYGRGGDNPPTGDNIVEHIIMLFISLSGFIIFRKVYKGL